MAIKFIQIIPVAFVMLAMGCSDSSSNSQINENAGIDGDTSYHYGIVPIDTSSDNAVKRDIDIVDEIECEDDDCVKEFANKTAYTFHSELTSLYEDLENAVFVGAFFEENGVRGITSDSNGNYWVTYRLLKSEEGETFVGWMWANLYRNNCARDSSEFFKSCEAKKGEFVDYFEGCKNNSLQLSCVYPYEYIDSEKTLKSLGEEFVEYAMQNWNEQKEVDSKKTEYAEYVTSDE